MPSHPIKRGGRFFQYRNGSGGFFWKGMATKTDLGAQPPDHPRLVVNGRYVGGHIVARPPIYDYSAHIPVRHGLTLTTEPWSPAFMAEHHSYAGLRLWWGSNAPVDVGGACGYVDTDNDPEFNEVAVYNQASGYTPVIERFANFIYVGNYGSLRRLYRVDGIPGNPAQYDTLTPSDEVVVAYPGFMTTALYLHEGRVYFALADPLGVSNGYIYSWDGFKSVLEYNMTTPGDDGVAAHSFRNTLVVTVRGLGSILVRSATGTWSTATVGGFESSGYMNSMAEVKSKLFIVDGATKIYSWNGTTLALERTITTGTQAELLNVCTTFNGRFYYLWTDHTATDTRTLWLGVHDPDTADATYKWKDDYKSLGVYTGVDAETQYAGEPMAVAVYRQRLMVARLNVIIKTGPNDVFTQVMTHSRENNPYSSWYITHPNPAVMTPTGPVYWPLSGILANLNTSMKYFKVL